MTCDLIYCRVFLSRFRVQAHARGIRRRRQRQHERRDSSLNFCCPSPWGSLLTCCHPVPRKRQSRRSNHPLIQPTIAKKGNISLPHTVAHTVTNEQILPATMTTKPGPNGRTTPIARTQSYTWVSAWFFLTIFPIVWDIGYVSMRYAVAPSLHQLADSNAALTAAVGGPDHVP